MHVPAVKTPLGIIALFVAVIELFLAYPVAQLHGPEQLVFVLFMVIFPTYVATAFFFILWHKPIHLYSPQDITPGLENRFQPAITHAAALEIRVSELAAKIEQFQTVSAVNSTAMGLPSSPPDSDRQLSQVESIVSELNFKLSPYPVLTPDIVQQARREVQESRTANRRALHVDFVGHMRAFRTWLESSGFRDLPPLPTIAIDEDLAAEASVAINISGLSAQVNPYFANDEDTAALVYFHRMMIAYGVVYEIPSKRYEFTQGLLYYVTAEFTGRSRIYGKVAQGRLASGIDLDDVALSNLPRSTTGWIGVSLASALWRLRGEVNSGQLIRAIYVAVRRMRWGSDSDVALGLANLISTIGSEIGQSAEAAAEAAFATVKNSLCEDVNLPKGLVAPL